jgi:hypothetical protein
VTIAPEVLVRRTLIAIHVVALALWLGSLSFSVALAGALFSRVTRPICPGCLKSWTSAEGLLRCTTCGALEHAECATRNKGCALEHDGSHECRTLPETAPAATGSLTGTSSWSRVRIASSDVSPARRLLWRLDGVTKALADAEGRLPLTGSCWDIPRPAVGDALARSFDLAQALAVACGVVALGTVLLTPPGGALRLLRAVALALGLGFAGWSVVLAGEVAAKRLPRESFQGETAAERAEFGAVHGLSTLAGLGELAFVLVALALATMAQEKTGASVQDASTSP